MPKIKLIASGLFIVFNAFIPSWAQTTAADQLRKALSLYVQMASGQTRPDWNKVLKRFQQIVDRFPQSDYAPRAQFELGFIYFYYLRAGKKGIPISPEKKPKKNLVPNPDFEFDWLVDKPYCLGANDEKAVKAFQRLLDRYPKSNKADDALYWLGIIYMFNFKDAEKAKEIFERLLKEHPNSEWVEYAKEKLKSTETSLQRAPAGWNWNISRNAQATVCIDPKVSKFGTRAVRFSNASEFGPHIYGTLWTSFKVKPNTIYTISCYAKAQEAHHCWFGGGPGWELRKSFDEGTYDWKRFSITYKTGQTETEFQLRFNIDGPTSALWVDGVQFEEGSEATEFER